MTGGRRRRELVARGERCDREQPIVPRVEWIVGVAAGLAKVLGYERGFFARDLPA